MDEKDKAVSPSKGYDLELKIDKRDYTNDLTSLRIVSSLSTAYPIFLITLMLDTTDILMENFSGAITANLTIRHIGRSDAFTPDEETNIKLSLMSPKNNIKTKPMIAVNAPREVAPLFLVGFPKGALETVSCTVNAVYSQMTPREIISSLVKKYTKANLQYDSDEENTNKIDQIIITPRSLYGTIKFIDKYYGLFNGASNVGYCTYDNQLQIFNLSKRITKNHLFTVNCLSSDNPKNSEIINKCNDGKHYYTLQPIKDEYTGNSRIQMVGNTYNYVVKPADKFVKLVEKKTKDVVKKYSDIAAKKVMGSNFQMIYDTVKNRTTYEETATADSGDNEAVMHSKITKALLQSAKLTITLEKDLLIKNLLKVGEVVKVITSTTELIDTTGNYLFKSSDIVFSRVASNWVCMATLVLCRSSKTM